MTTQELLEKISHQGLVSSTKEEIIRLACAYWHEDFLPDTDRLLKLGVEQQKRAGYLTERFSLYHCVNESRALQLVELAYRIKARVNPIHNNNNPDQVAAEWGLVENINPFLGDILYYQTRHYQHTPNNNSL